MNFITSLLQSKNKIQFFNEQFSFFIRFVMESEKLSLSNCLMFSGKKHGDADKFTL